jgi:hypothetical protein
MSGSSPAARVGKSKVVDRAVERFCPGFWERNACDDSVIFVLQRCIRNANIQADIIQ